MLARSLTGVLLLALIGTPLAAQGVGSVTAGPFNVEAPTDPLNGTVGTQGNLGVEYTGAVAGTAAPLGNLLNPNASVEYFWVTARGTVAPTTGLWVTAAPHTVYQYDMSGNLLYQFTQASTVAAATWGHRDMAADMNGDYIMVADDDGVNCFDRHGNYAGGVASNPAPIMAANGPQLVGFPIPLPPTTLGSATHPGFPRGLAYNPNGNGGNGSLWTANFASDLVEFDLTGAPLASFVSNGLWSIYGLAWDSVRGTLWASTSPNQGDLAEIDPATGTETGNRMVRAVGGAQGGADICYRSGPGVPHSEVVYLAQSTPDAVVFQRLDLYTPALGSGYIDEVTIEVDSSGAFPAGGFTSGNRTFYDGDTLTWQYGNAGAAAGSPAALLVNIDGVLGSTLGVPELCIPTQFSSPPANPATNFELGNTTGLPSGLTALGLGPALVGDPAASFPAPPGFFPAGAVISLQAFVIDGIGIYTGNPWPGYATNKATLSAQGPPPCPPLGAVFTANGTNNFGAAVPLNTAYWTIANNSAGQNILSVTLDWAAANVVGANTTVFDYDQGGITGVAVTTGVFQNGNSTVAGCEGTIINDPGLDFGPSSSIIPPCDPAAFCGWSTTSALAGSCQNLTFTFGAGGDPFGPGETFGWNGDTDGGNGITGDTMAGLQCTIVWDNGCVSIGYLAATVPGLTSVANL